VATALLVLELNADLVVPTALPDTVVAHGVVAVVVPAPAGTEVHTQSGASSALVPVDVVAADVVVTAVVVIVVVVDDVVVIDVVVVDVVVVLVVVDVVLLVLLVLVSLVVVLVDVVLLLAMMLPLVVVLLVVVVVLPSVLFSPVAAAASPVVVVPDATVVTVVVLSAAFVMALHDKKIKIVASDVHVNDHSIAKMTCRLVCRATMSSKTPLSKRQVPSPCTGYVTFAKT